MSASKTVVLTKTHYKIPTAAKILGITYANFYQQVSKNELFVTINGQRFLTAGTLQSLFNKYRPLDTCNIDSSYNVETY